MRGGGGAVKGKADRGGDALDCCAHRIASSCAPNIWGDQSFMPQASIRRPSLDSIHRRRTIPRLIKGNRRKYELPHIGAIKFTPSRVPVTAIGLEANATIS